MKGEVFSWNNKPRVVSSIIGYVRRKVCIGRDMCRHILYGWSSVVMSQVMSRSCSAVSGNVVYRCVLSGSS